MKSFLISLGALALLTVGGPRPCDAQAARPALSGIAISPRLVSVEVDSLKRHQKTAEETPRLPRRLADFRARFDTLVIAGEAKSAGVALPFPPDVLALTCDRYASRVALYGLKNAPGWTGFDRWNHRRWAALTPFLALPAPSLLRSRSGFLSNGIETRCVIGTH